MIIDFKLLDLDMYDKCAEASNNTSILRDLSLLFSILLSSFATSLSLFPPFSICPSDFWSS